MKANHTCLNCGHLFEGNFCNNCGEKVYTEHDKSVPHLFEEAFHFFTHFEGKFFSTLKAVLLKPGKLSTDYCAGIRKKYFKPLSFFLLLVIVYLLFPLFDGLNMQLRYHKTEKLYGAYATAQIEKIMEKRHITEEQLSDIFHHKSEKASKFLLFIIIPFMALVSWGMGFKKRKPYFDHFIFSTEAASALILTVFLLFPALLNLGAFIGLPFNHLREEYTWPVVLILFSLSVAFMARRFFQFRWWYNTLFTGVFISFTGFFLMNIYKLILFVTAIQLV